MSQVRAVDTAMFERGWLTTSYVDLRSNATDSFLAPVVYAEAARLSVRMVCLLCSRRL